MELQEEDFDYKTQLDLIMSAFDAITARHRGWWLRPIWNRWWGHLDTILPPLLPWERGLRYCVLEPEIPYDRRPALLQLHGWRHIRVLKRLGYAEDVEFLDVIKDHIPGVLDLRLETLLGTARRRHCRSPVQSHESETSGSDDRFSRRFVRRRRSF